MLDTDDEHTLAARILEQEHAAYSEAINLVLSEQLEIVGRRFARNIRHQAPARSAYAIAAIVPYLQS